MNRGHGVFKMSTHHKLIKDIDKRIWIESRPSIVVKEGLLMKEDCHLVYTMQRALNNISGDSPWNRLHNNAETS